MPEELLDYQRMRTWAEGKPEGYEVGIACTNSRCPIANYLHEQTQKLWTVGPSIRPMDGTKNHLDKPAWVEELIERIDGTSDSNDGKTVTREQFLHVLEKVKP